MSDLCRSCRAPIIWTITTNGKRMPVDREPDPARGNVMVDQYGNAQYLNAEQRSAYLAKGGKLHLSHFVTCPFATTHRRVLRRLAS